MKTKSSLKKVTALLLTFIMVFGTTPAASLSQLPDLFDGFAISAQAESESILTFTLINGGTEYEVSDCDDKYLEYFTLPASYNGKPVTRIGDYAFSDCSGLCSITIPDSVRSIGKGAFADCRGLSGVSIPDSVTSMGDYAFSGCFGLGSIIIPYGVTSIGECAFFGCRSLCSIIIPDSVTSIGSNALANSGLASVNIPDSVTSIGSGAFEGSSIASVTIPDSVISIGSSAFFGSAISTIAIPDSVTSIGDYAFSECLGLVSATIGNGVTSIGREIFSYCINFRSLIIGNSVKSIDISAFSGSPAFSDITVSPANEYYSSIDGVLFSKDKTELILYPRNTETSYSIPDSVTHISERAFYYCSKLSSITIPDSVTSIGKDAFCGTAWYNNQPDGLVYIGKAAYKYKGTMPVGTAVDIKDGTISITDSAFSDYFELHSITIPDSVTSIGDYAFYYCGGLRSITIPDSVTDIGNYVFSGCTGLRSITISDSVTSIGQYVFSNCRALSSITIPDSVTSVGDNAFSICYNLTDVYYGGDENDRAKITIGSNNKDLLNATWHYNLPVTGVSLDKTNETLTVGDTQLLTATIAPENATNKNVVWASSDPAVATVSSTGLVTAKAAGNATITVTTADGSKTANCTVTVIADESILTFTLINGGTEYKISGCDSEATGALVIPATYKGKPVTRIGYEAFSGCSGLSFITIPNSVTGIDARAFRLCTGINSITIPDSVTSIGYSAFYYCENLSSITIGNSVTNIGEKAFINCTGLSSVTIPDSVTSIGEMAFESCTGLVSVTIGNSVTSIGEKAFSGCTGLSSVTIPDSVTSIGDSVFFYCMGLSNITVGSANANYSSQDGVLFKKDKTCLIQYPVGNTRTSYSIPNSVKSIGDYAFWGCTGLASITISDSVKSIGDMAFYCCKNFSSITIGNSVTSIGNRAFTGCNKLTDVYYGSNENDRAKIAIGSNNEKLINATWHYSIRVTGVSFDKTNETLTVGDTQQLTATIAPENATNKNVVWASSDPAVATVSSTGLVTAKAAGNATITVTTADGSKTASCTVTVIADGSILTFTLINGGTEYEVSDCDDEATGTLVIPASYNGKPVTSIGEGAFVICTGLSGVNIPDSVTNIGDYAFEACINLESITIPDRVTSIGESAFYYCVRLSSVRIPDSVTSIGYRAFYDCNKLTDVYYSGDESDRAKIAIAYSNENLINATWHYVVSVTGVALDITGKTLKVGETLQLTATVAPKNATNKAVIWKSSNTHTATVDQNGLVRGKAVGNVIITATTVDGSYSAICNTVIIMPVNATISIINYSGLYNVKLNWWKKYSTATMSLGFYTYNCEAAVRYVWSSSNSRVKIDQNGNITNIGIFSRSSTITLTAYDAEDNVVAKSSTKVRFYKFDWQESKLQSQATFSDDRFQQNFSEQKLDKQGGILPDSIASFISSFISYLTLF